MCLVAHRSRGSPYFALAITLSLHWNQGRTPGYPPASRIGRVGVLPPHTLGGFGGSEKRPPERYDAHCQGSGGGSLVPGVMTGAGELIDSKRGCNLAPLSRRYFDNCGSAPVHASKKNNSPPARRALAASGAAEFCRSLHFALVDALAPCCSTAFFSLPRTAGSLPDHGAYLQPLEIIGRTRSPISDRRSPDIFTRGGLVAGVLA